MATPLLRIWLDQFAGRDRIDLREEQLPRLLDLLPPDFGIWLHEGSVAMLDGDGDVRIEFSGMVQPDLFGAFSSLGRTQTGPMHRTISTRGRSARHHVFRLPPAWTGQMRGRLAVRQSVELYRALGVDEVSLVAVDDGRYAWAMCGFDFATQRDREDVFRASVAFADRMDIELDLGDVYHSWELASTEGDVTLRDVAHALGVTDLNLPELVDDKLDSPMRIGKALMMFSDVPGWEGRLYTGTDSPCYKQLLRYTDTGDGS
jgi:hypothetical protein